MIALLTSKDRAFEASMEDGTNAVAGIFRFRDDVFNSLMIAESQRRAGGVGEKVRREGAGQLVAALRIDFLPCENVGEAFAIGRFASRIDFSAFASAIPRAPAPHRIETFQSQSGRIDRDMAGVARLV